MNIQINTDNNVDGNAEIKNTLKDYISSDLDRFSDQITRIEVHLSDEDGNKDGINDRRCLLEARLAGMQPLAVTNRANSDELAVSGALEKMENKLNTILGRLRDR